MLLVVFYHFNDSSGMRRIKTLFETVCDWLVVKWRVLIGGERLSRDKMERFDWLIQKLGGGRNQP